MGPQPAPVFSGRSCDDWHFPAGSPTVAVPKHQVPTAPEPLRPRQAFLVLRGLFWAFSIVTADSHRHGDHLDWMPQGG